MNPHNANRNEAEWNQLQEASLNDPQFSELEFLKPEELEAAQQEVDLEVEQLSEAVDEAIENGEYANAAELQAEAEVLVDQSKQTDVLDGPSSDQLDLAAEHQSEAALHERSEAAHAQAGDYAGAGEQAAAAELHMKEADALAGGSDHSGQASLEVDQMDWASFHQEQAQSQVADAKGFADDGNWDAAANALDASVDSQAAADHHGDLGEHGGAISLDDPFSTTANDVGFENDASFDVPTNSDTSFDSSSTYELDYGTDSI